MWFRALVALVTNVRFRGLSEPTITTAEKFTRDAGSI